MMTREEAIALFEKQLTAAQVVLDSGFGSNPGENDSLYRRRKEMAEIALSALRPVSREQVEKVWRGEWVLHKSDDVFSSYHTCSNCGCKYGESSGVYIFDLKFCPHCGVIMKAEAVDMVIERLEALHSETKTD